MVDRLQIADCRLLGLGIADCGCRLPIWDADCRFGMPIADWVADCRLPIADYPIQ
jgi:hypothetical protein